MVDQSPITANELAEEVGLSLHCLKLAFREEHAHLLAEFCDPWEEIGYHLKLTKSNITSIKDDNATTEKRRIATLQKWKEKFAHRATYQVLIEALIKSEHADQALKLLKKIKHEIRPVSESDGASIVPRDPSLCNMAEPTSPVGYDTSSEDFVPGADITQSIYNLQMRFICIQNRFLQSNAGTGVTLEQLQTCISTLPSFTTDTPQVLLEASSIPTFVHNLKQYCCALDPDILEGLIEVLGDVETKSMMKAYSRDLHNFQCKTKLNDFVGNYEGPTPPEYKEVQIKLGEGWREKTLADVKQLKSQISRQSWLMKMVSIGSVCVTFMVPQVEDLELDVHLVDYLRSQCVLQIVVCGVCVFNCEGERKTTSMNGSQEEMITEEVSKKSSQISLGKDEVAVQEVRDYFVQMTCNLRVLGSQLGLEPYELDEIEYQATSLSDQKQRLVDKCIYKEKLISWEHLAATLEKPALNMYRMANEIRAKHVYSRQYSLESCSSINSPTSTRMDSLSSQEASISSSMEVDLKFTIPEAVNLIVMVDSGSLRELGRKLGVDEARLTRLFSYDAGERHQRLIEAWFEHTTPSRDTLLEVLPRRESSVSMSSVPLTPTSEPPDDIERDERMSSVCSPSYTSILPTDTESQIEYLEKQFTNMQIAARKELEGRQSAVELVKDQLTAMPLQKKDQSAIRTIARRKKSFQNLTEFFLYLNTRCWNFLEYHLLKQLILNTCSGKLKKKVKTYAEEVQNFQQNTTITEFLKYRRHMAKARNIPESYKALKMKHKIDPDLYTLADLEKLRRSTCDHVKLSDFALQIQSISTNCIVVEWIIPEEITEILSLFYSSEVGQQLLCSHHIESVFIDDKALHSWVLLAAIKSGDYKRASSILQEKYTDLDLNCQDYDNGRTVLFYAVTCGMFDLVQKLLEQGADLNITDMDGNSPLMLAAEKGYELVILLLLDHKANIDFKQEATGRTALFFSAENGHGAATSILLAYGADPNQQDVGGETPYTVAEKEEVCKELQPLEMKKQPDVRSDSAYHKFITESIQGISRRFQSLKVALLGQDRVAIDLIEAAKNDDIKTVEHILQKEDLSTIIDARESDEDGVTALMWASDRGNIKIIQLLLDKGADVNMTTKSHKWSSLMIASRKGHLNVVKTLIEHGAEINHQNIDGVSSLTISLYEKRTAVAIFLIHKGANINLAEKTGWNPLIRASNEGNLKLVKIIADRGGQLNSQTLEFGWTSVMVASKYGHDEVVKELAERGANLNLTTKDGGDTALHIATLRRKPNVIRQLAECRAKLDIPNKDGLTALMIATNKGYKEEIDALLDGGADVNYPHEETGWTAVFCAAKNGSVEIVQNFLHHGAKIELKDGTHLNDVASQLKQMSIMHILGTSVDSPVPQQESKDVDHSVRTFEALFNTLEKRIRAWIND